MSNNSIYTKIEEKASNEAENIRLENLKKCENTRAAILQEANDYVDKLINDNKMKNADIYKTKLTEIEQNTKQKELACKKAIIKDVYHQALTKLVALDDQKFISLIKKLIINSSINGNEVLLVSSNEFNRYLRLFSDQTKVNDMYDLNKLNKMLGNKYQLHLLDKQEKMEGGFIIISENYDIDNSYQTILNDLATSMETETAMLLFGKSNA